MNTDPKIIAERMRFIEENEFIDDGHEKADELMCELLRELGYGEAVEIFEKMKKWYS